MRKIVERLEFLTKTKLERRKKDYLLDFNCNKTPHTTLGDKVELLCCRATFY